MSVILFVDMLGAQKKWQTGGVPEAIEAFEHFAKMVIAAIREEPSGSVAGGGIETDSAMIVFASALPALRAAKRLFLWAFYNRLNPTAPRLWLRGSLVRHDAAVPQLRRESRMSAPFESVSIFTYTAAAFDAISVEKSGFKGMRLLLRDGVIDTQTKAELKIGFDNFSFTPFRKLRHIGYPSVSEGDLNDFLWMACGDDQEWRDLSLHMTSRLRHAAKDPDEFAQAAATQVVFHECGAIRQSVISRARRARESVKGQQSATADTLPRAAGR